MESRLANQDGRAGSAYTGNKGGPAWDRSDARGNIAGKRTIYLEVRRDRSHLKLKQLIGELALNSIHGYELGPRHTSVGNAPPVCVSL